MHIGLRVSRLLARVSHSNRVSGTRGLRFRETAFSTPETQLQIGLSNECCAVSETKSGRQSRAISGLFTHLQEISANLGLPGGPGRIRTSNQTVMSGRL